MNTEHLLVERAQGGDERAFDHLIRLNQPALTGVLLSLSGEPAAAEEMSRRAFLLAYQRLDRFKAGTSFKAFVTRLALKLARSRARWARARRWLSGEGAERAAEASWDGADPGLLSRKLAMDKSLSGLSRREREVACLRLEGYRLAEIESALGLRGTKVQSALVSAAQKLKGRLE